MILHQWRITIMSFIFLSSYIMAEEVSFITEPGDQRTQNITVTVTLFPKERLFKDSIAFFIDHPSAQLSSWSSDQQAKAMFDPSFQESKQSYTGTVQFHLTLQHTDPKPSEATLFMRYLLNTSKELREKNFTIPLITEEPDDNNLLSLLPTTHAHEHETSSPSLRTLSMYLHQLIDAVTAFVKQHIITWTRDVAKISTQSSSFGVQLLFVLLLGILMSLTPCLYPMIPITIGILQATNDAKRSFLNNFLVAFSYTAGMSITFAIMGLLAATGSARFGQLLGSPFFTVLLVGFLAYMGCSMLGWYELYIPRFLQPRHHEIKSGSFISTFIFGVLSGTFASPCLSPGLALVLSMAVSTGSGKAFILLFMFGIGSSLPLLIIGTFSNALSMLPRSGMWMVEIKKLFGFMLFGMCLYYLRSIVPSTIVWWLAGFLLLGIGIYYILSVDRYKKSGSRNIMYFIGTLFIAISLLMFLHAYRATQEVSSPWFTNYEQALHMAHNEHKKLLLDFSANWCSLCHELEKNILKSSALDQILGFVVPVTIDCTNLNAEPCATLQKQYTIVGLPTLLLVDPEDGHVIRRWGSELLDVSPCDFAEEIITLAS